MFTVCHTEEAELLPPQMLPRCPVYDTILIWFLILFPVLSWRNPSGWPAQPGLTWRNPSGWPAQPGLTWGNQFLLVTQPI